MRNRVWSRRFPAKAADPAAVSPPRARPTLFLIGDSTVRNRTRGQLGWGEPIAGLFDQSKITVTNRALGGRSSRTFLTEGLWDKVLAELKPGDFVLIQFGHNDGGELAKGDRPRASLKGNSDETKDVAVERTGKPETVHTFGWYMRQYAREAKAKAVTPILCSLVPRKIWKNGKVARGNESHGQWTAEAARAEGVAFLDLNEIIARRYEALGAEKVETLFADQHTHTTPAGAELNAASVIAGLKGLSTNPLAPFFSEKARTVTAYVE